MANYFDQFDEVPAQTSANYFDQFDEPAKETSDKGFLGRRGDDVKRGFARLRSTGDVLSINDAVTDLRLMDLVDAQSIEDYRSLEKASQQARISPNPRQIESYLSMSPEQKKAFRKKRIQQVTDNVADLAARNKEAAEIPVSDARQAFNQSEGFGDAFSAFLDSPLEVASSLSTESLVQFAPALPFLFAGPAGAAMGAGGTSLANEYAGDIIGSMQEAGIDTQSPEAIQKALTDPEQVDKWKERASKRAVPIALIDALSAGVGGRFVEMAKSPAKKALAAGGEALALQPVLGGSGEVAGALAVGDEIEGRDVLAEMIGELGPGTVETGAGIYRSARDARAARRKNAQATEQQTPTPDTAPFDADQIAALERVVEQDQIQAGTIEDVAEAVTSAETVDDAIAAANAVVDEQPAPVGAEAFEFGEEGVSLAADPLATRLDEFGPQMPTAVAVPPRPDEDTTPELMATEGGNFFDQFDAEPAQQAPSSIEGESIDGEWARFNPESGTLNIPRTEMPQIKAEHRGAMVNFLNARGIEHQEETIPAADLKPTQAEFSREKVAKAKEFTGGDRSILVSADNHVVDGHHQWIAKRDQGEEVKVIRLDAPIRELLPVAAEFPSAEQDGGSQQANDQTAAQEPAQQITEQEELLSQTNELGFYSGLSRSAQDLKQERGTPEQMLNAIKKQAGVKAEEIEFTGLEQYLKLREGEKVSKREIVEYLDNNGVQVEEVQRQNFDYASLVPEGWTVTESATGQVALSDQAGKHVGEGDSLGNALADADIRKPEGKIGKDTKYGDYQLPGGENYREVLLTLPTTASPEQRTNLDRLYQERGSLRFSNRPVPAELDSQIAQLEAEARSYSSSHFDEPNILAHVRLNDRTDAEGNKVLFVEEIQSDWHAEGRKKGYNDKRAQELEARRRELEEQGMAAAKTSADQIPAEIKEEWVAVMNELQPERARTPDAPFKGNAWAELALKRILRMAAEGGYDAVSWTTGEQQAERYNLSKQVDAIQWTKVGDGKYQIQAEKDGRLLPAFNGNRTAVVGELELETYIGKDAAKKIQDSPAQDGDLTGEDLQVGGQGMRGFYDRTLPNIAKKVARKLDKSASVTTTTIDGVGEVHTLRLSDASRESALEGQPLFRATNEFAQGIPVEEVQTVVDAFLKKYKGADDGLKVRVHATQADFMRATNKDPKKYGRLKGEFVPRDNTAHLVAGNLGNAQQALHILQHEIIVHKGLGFIPIEQRERLINTIAENAPQSPALKEAWATIEAEYPRASDRIRAEELLARMAERNLSTVDKYLQKIFNVLKSILVRLGFLEPGLRKQDLIEEVYRFADAFAEGRQAPARTSGSRMSQESDGSARAPWNDFPPVESLLKLKTLEQADPELYKKAKAGDPDAAIDLVEQILTDEAVGRIQTAIGDRKPVLVPVRALEASGNNRIPSAFAKILGARLGVDVDSDIIQSARANHTDAGAYERIVRQPEFDGPVQDGQDYVILDDTVTMGGTLAALRGHIERQGGNVILASALTGFQDQLNIRPTAKMLAAVRNKHGGELENWWQEQFGFPLEQLTQGELGHLRVAPSLDAIRDRLSEAGLPDRREADGRTPEGQETGVDDSEFLSQERFPENKAVTTTLQKLGLALRKGDPKKTVAFLLGGETAETTHPSTQEQNKLKAYAKRLFTKEGQLTDEAFARHIESMGIKNDADLVAQFMVDGMVSAAKKAYKRTWPRIDDAAKEKMNEYLAGNNRADVPPKVKEALDAMRTSLDNLSGDLQTMLVDEIMYRLHALPASKRQKNIEVLRDSEADLTEADIDPIVARKAALYRTIQENKGEYLNRSYRVFDDDGWKDDVAPAVVERARDYLRSQVDADPAFEELSENAKADHVEGIINKILNPKARDMLSFMGSEQLGQKDLSTLKRRKEIAPEIRELMGEYKDPRLNYSRSMAKMSYLVANHHFLRSVREDGLGVFLSAKPSGNMFKEITSWDENTMTPLAGLYATPEFAAALHNATTPRVSEGWLRTYLIANTGIKYGKTVLSPTTMARNFYSAAMFTVMNGHFDWTHAVKAGSHTWADLGSSNPKKMDYLRKLVKLGVLHDNPKAQELREALDEVTDMNVLEGSLPARAVKTLLNAATKMYRAGDDFWKIIGFENERAGLMRDGMSAADAETMAADRIRNGYPTYSMVPESIRMLRRFPLVGTFVSFPWEMLRTTAHQFRMMNEDRKAGRTGMFTKRAIGMMIAGGLTYGISKVTMAMFGLTDDDDEAIRRMGPEWQENAQLAYLGYGEEGKLRYLDLSHLDPYTYLKAPFAALANGNYETVDEKAAAAMGEFLEPFLGTEIGFGALLDVWTNSTDYGPVYDENADKWTQGKQVFEHLKGELQPGVFSNVERTLKAWNGEYASYGRKYDKGDEALAWIGFRMTTMDPNIALRFRAYEFNDQRSDASKPVYSVMRDPNIGAYEKLPEALERTRGQWNSAFKDMAAAVRAARTVGMETREIAEALEWGGVPKKYVRALLNDRIPEWEPFGPTIDQARESVRRTRRSDEERAAITQEFRERRKVLNELLSER